MRSLHSDIKTLAAVVALSSVIAAQSVPESRGTGKVADGDRQAPVLRELIRRGLEGNQEIVALRRDVEAAEKMLAQSRLLPNPMVEALRERDRDGMDSSIMLSAALPLEINGSRGARIKMARAELDIRNQALRTREFSLAYEIGVAAVELSASLRKLEIVSKSVEAASRSFQLTVRSVTEGKKAPLDEGLEGVELNRMRAVLERSHLDVELKRNALRNLLGGDPSLDLPALDQIPSVGMVDGDARELTEEALKLRPDLAGARAVEDLADGKMAAARADGRPQTELMAGYERATSRFGAFGTDSAGMPMSLDREMRMFSFGVRISLPVINRNQGAIAAARAELEAARQRRIFGEMTVRREVASAVARADRENRALQILRVGVLDQARRNLEVVRESYELGGRSLMDYLIEQQKLLDAEMEFVESEAGLAVSRLDLLRAIGAKELLGL